MTQPCAPGEHRIRFWLAVGILTPIAIWLWLRDMRGHVVKRAEH